MQIRQRIFNLQWHENYAFYIRQNSETSDVLHAFLSLVLAKLCDLKNSQVFFWPTLYTLKTTREILNSKYTAGTLQAKMQNKIQIPKHFKVS